MKNMKRNSKKSKIILSRKETRKNKRKEKKQRRLEYYTRRKKPENSEKADPTPSSSKSSKFPKPSNSAKDAPEKTKVSNEPTFDDLRKKEIHTKKKLENQMKSRRRKQMVEANLHEDRVIKHLEKQLKLNKRKSKSIPKSFAADGLDYLLEMCDPEANKGAVTAERQLTGTNEDFEEDFFLMTGKSAKEDSQIEDDEGSIVDSEGFDNEDSSDDQDEKDVEVDSDNNSECEANSLGISEESDVETAAEDRTSILKRKQKSDMGTHNDVKRKKITTGDSDIESENDSEHDIQVSGDDGDIDKFTGSENSSSDDIEFSERGDIKGSGEGDSGDDTEASEAEVEENSEDDAKNSEGDEIQDVWEDIYGRKRKKDGTVVEEPEKQKYIPPSLRAKQENSNPQQTEKLNRLRKQLKGLLNRLAESNLHNISSQIENLYMNNGRYDMNHTITSLILEALVSPVNTPERLLMEHVILMAVLHANVGTEVGAHFLQTVVKQFDTHLQGNHEVENKTIDNLVKIIAQLYNFGLYDSKLLYEVLDVLSSGFGEKEVECILHVLRNVGFSLRKDNPLALKELILNLQKKASSVPANVMDNSRVKFMLDILLAIKNNNVNKIPNYDTSYSEHLKKIMKSFIRKGNYVSPLNISLQDLLKAEEKGKWWVVGSAWSGNNLEEKVPLKNEPKEETYSQKLLELARKQRMNTDTRRSIFCIIMSAEDYLDAFEKLLHLGLKNQQQREIINVIIHCALHERNYNPYYSVLTQKFCEYDRKYQMALKYLVWDKLKVLSDHSASQISNLAKLLTHLFIEKALSISALKIIQFSELDKLNVRFVRQVLLGILLHENAEAVQGVFEKIWQADKLKMFRESLHLFICHFLLSNLKEGIISDEQKQLLESRAKMVEQILMAKKEKFAF